MSRRTNYYLSTFFQPEFDKLIRSHKRFQYERTSYTRKLKTSHSSIIFNADGCGDSMILSLINQVRNDARKYLERNVDLPNTPIYFTEMFTVPHENEIIMKVDLTSAYWKQALRDEIVTEKTNQYFVDTFSDRTGKEQKSIRLKALGSLATRKEVETFDGGKSVSWEIDEQPTKQIYMNICRQIDNVMRECRQHCDGCVLYYWDCMFVKKQFAQDVINFFREKQFECKQEETRLSFDTIGTKSYFTSEIDGKMYMVQHNDKHLLNQFNDEQ